NKTKMVIRSDTHKAKGKVGFNEISFEDENGREEIYVHAEKDRNEKVNHNHTERIDNNWVQSVGHNKAIEVTNNHDEVIGGNMTLSVGPSGIGSIVNAAFTKLTAGISGVAKGLGLPALFNPGEGNMGLFVEKNKSETVGLVSADQIGVGRYFTVGQTFEVSSGSSIAFTAEEKLTESVGKIRLIEAGEEFTVSVGPVRISANAKGELYLDAPKIFINGSELVDVKSRKIKLN
ncbi:bacteriophage T4 gp5 trimerisation domain-containing protein, partial [Phyllobacterium leguminum]